MTKLFLTVVVGAFVAAFAEEVMSREKRGIRTRLKNNAEEFKRGFMQGYRGLPVGSLPSGPGAVG